MSSRRSALGRGLGALIPAAESEAPATPEPSAASADVADPPARSTAAIGGIRRLIARLKLL